ncbi:MAG: nucleotidyltransferase family protein [Coprococcus sp.]
MLVNKEASFVFSMACAVVGQTELPLLEENLDWEQIYQISVYHRIENIVSYAVEQICKEENRREPIPEEVRKQFQKAKVTGIMGETIQHHEYDKVTTLFEEEAVEHMLLKGGWLKYDYPSQDMRFLTDLDILVRKADADRVAILLEQLGYKMVCRSEKDDVYQKEPCMTIEIHKTSVVGYESLDAYLEGIWERSRKREGYKTEYLMTWEDFYLYQTGHMAKHFEHGGVGMRMLLDFLVFENERMSCCDRALIEEQLKLAGLLKMEEKIRELLLKGIDRENPENAIVWEYILESGTYGLFKFHVQKERNKHQSKGAYYLGRVFPKREELLFNYPQFRKYPCGFLAAWFYRLFKNLIIAPDKTVGELRALRNEKEHQKVIACMREMGLEEKDEKI